MTLIEKPVAGQPMRAGWGASVAERLNQIGSVGAPGQLVREGLFGQGIAPLPKNQRDRRGTPAAPQPFEVRWDKSLAEGDGGWKIYLPGEHLLSVDGEYIDELGGVTAIEDDNGDETGWFEFDEIDASATAIWLVVAKEESGNEGEATVSAQFATEEDAEGANNVCIAEVSFTAASQSTPAVVEIKQSVVGALVLTGSGAEPDDISIELTPPQEEGEEPTGDEGKLQIFDFDSNDSDSPEGLAERLKADTETGDIKIQSGTNIMLLARRDGKMVYIPLSADGDDPEDEKPYDPENPDPCAHPGDNAPGGATSESIDGGGGGVDGGAGGVPAGGCEPHTGDDDCNCEKI